MAGTDRIGVRDTRYLGELCGPESAKRSRPIKGNQLSRLVPILRAATVAVLVWDLSKADAKQESCDFASGASCAMVVCEEGSGRADK